MRFEEAASRFQENVSRLKAECAKVIVGQEGVVNQTLTGLLAGGHILLEGVPGLGKTLLVRTLAQALQLRFRRIQFTPDLMPADITGTNILIEDETRGRHFTFQHGPVFGNIILADEINRATPKTQSALLEAMQEEAVTVSGNRHELPQPFFVIATQNPIEMEGTYPLPEAQLDRFLFKVLVRAGDAEELVRILERTTGEEPSEVEAVLDGESILAMRRTARQVAIARPILDYVARLVRATHPDGGIEEVSRYVRFGASPRGGQAMVLAGKVQALTKGRFNVSTEDVRESAPPALRHRLILNFEAEAEGIDGDLIVRRILESVPELPREVRKLL